LSFLSLQQNRDFSTDPAKISAVSKLVAMTGTVLTYAVALEQRAQPSAGQWRDIPRRWHRACPTTRCRSQPEALQARGTRSKPRRLMVLWNAAKFSLLRGSLDKSISPLPHQ